MRLFWLWTAVRGNFNIRLNSKWCQVLHLHYTHSNITDCAFKLEENQSIEDISLEWETESYKLKNFSVMWNINAGWICDGNDFSWVTNTLRIVLLNNKKQTKKPSSDNAHTLAWLKPHVCWSDLPIFPYAAQTWENQHPFKFPGKLGCKKEEPVYRSRNDRLSFILDI